ncbi:Carbonic anhydrase 2 [Durusdinium trenchii]|uniref:Carbonic anhydrase n=1 Tax=Durusdinium trenchii TaxID=1381693 RepID=A0ABP0J7W3_9DINO
MVQASQALDVLLNELSSVVSEAQAQCGRKATEDEIAAKAIKLNVFHTINFLLQYSEPIREKVRSGKLEIQGGIYDLKSGQVEFLGQSPMQSKLVKSTSTAAPSLQQKLVAVGGA